MAGYTDFAEYYDYNHTISDDIDFYSEYAGLCQSPILELACGTGRVAIPLAEAGSQVYGVDISPNMLDVCQRKVEKHGLKNRVHLSLGDMADFELSRQDFELAIIALRSFMHLLTHSDQLACLHQVYKHLHPGGQFILDVIAPDLERLAMQPSETFVLHGEFDLPNGHHVLRKDRLLEHNRLKQVRHFEFKFEEFDTDGKRIRERLVPVRTRYIFRIELELMLNTAGFEVVDIFRDYSKNPYDGTGEMIVVTQRSLRSNRPLR